MAELSLDAALEALNAARTYLSPVAVEICICGHNEGVDVECLTDAPSGPLHDFMVKAEEAAEVVTKAMGVGPDALFLTEDHRGRWILIPIVE